MPRNMSFALTTAQVRNRTKTVTRRFGWWFLKPGDLVWAVERSMGLQKGERVKRLCQIRVTSVRTEPLNAITQMDCIAEGFPEMKPAEFVAMLANHYRCDSETICNRIEFDYLGEPTCSGLCRTDNAR